MGWGSEDYREHLLIIRATKPLQEILNINMPLPMHMKMNLNLLIWSECNLSVILLRDPSRMRSRKQVYQVRGWRAWHHHMVLVMKALHFILSEKILYNDKYPLLSAYDIRDIIIRVYSKKMFSSDEVLDQIRKRHEQRGLENLNKDSS
ncbi:hypothetical protein DXN04_19245 [Chitinophaga silvisoli]|uniref:Uncharacterized protein n=1 Tax=Chitinophaga silvisoli TaxID=2291814 RepID=A0A3E1NZJ3_9BACT|nr:hypothetical protein DXN04_19245 [Chitinophaga silvisoli]